MHVKGRKCIGCMLSKCVGAIIGTGVSSGVRKTRGLQRGFKEPQQHYRLYGRGLPKGSKEGGQVGERGSYSDQDPFPAWALGIPLFVPQVSISPCPNPCLLHALRVGQVTRRKKCLLFKERSSLNSQSHYCEAALKRRWISEGWRWKIVYEALMIILGLDWQLLLFHWNYFLSFLCTENV